MVRLNSAAAFLAFGIPCFATTFDVSYTGSGQNCTTQQHIETCAATTAAYSASFSLSNLELSHNGSYDVLLSLNLTDSLLLFEPTYVANVLQDNDFIATAVTSGGAVTDLQLSIAQDDQEFSDQSFQYDLTATGGTFNDNYLNEGDGFGISIIDSGSYTILECGSLVPEPSRFALLGVGLLGIPLCRRRILASFRR